MKRTKEHKTTLKDVENFTNSVLIPRLRKQARTNKALCERANMIMFLYSVGHISAIESVIRLSLLDLMGTDDFKELKEYFKEELKIMKFSELRKQMSAFNEKHGIKRKVDEKYKDDKSLIKMVGRVVVSNKDKQLSLCDTLKQARKEAQDWKKETMEIIVIEKVTKEVIETI